MRLNDAVCSQLENTHPVEVYTVPIKSVMLAAVLCCWCCRGCSQTRHFLNICCCQLQQSWGHLGLSLAVRSGQRPLRVAADGHIRVGTSVSVRQYAGDYVVRAGAGLVVAPLRPVGCVQQKDEHV